MMKAVLISRQLVVPPAMTTFYWPFTVNSEVQLQRHLQLTLGARG